MPPSLSFLPPVPVGGYVCLLVYPAGWLAGWLAVSMRACSKGRVARGLLGPVGDHAAVPIHLHSAGGLARPGLSLGRSLLHHGNPRAGFGRCGSLGGDIPRAPEQGDDGGGGGGGGDRQPQRLQQ